METKRIILGIDPGTTFTGYGIVSGDGKLLKLETYGYLDLSKLTDHYEKLEKIFKRTLSLIDEFGATEFAVEAPFFEKNVQSMLKLGRAQGVAMSAALYRGLPVTEYSPRKVKSAVTGNGAASKEQVAEFLKKILNFNLMPEKLDVTDGIAVAVCHFYQQKFEGASSAKSWKDFITKNPNRVK
jgi:crossover junction endodeoxyribonuclease RuvC